MKEIIPNLFVGDINDCNKENFAIIHACKHPCFLNALNLKKVPKEHPNYLFYQEKNHLYLNLVDWSNGVPNRDIIVKILDETIKFIEERIKNEKILIHCSKGTSRAPLICAYYLRSKNILNKNFLDEFKETYMPEFNLSQGYYTIFGF